MPKRIFAPISHLTKRLTAIREEYGQLTIISLIVGVLLAFNFVFRPINLRVDLSKNKAYSLSPASRQILKKIPQEIRLKVYISANIPARLKAVEKDALDLIGEYVQANPDKLKLQKFDPEKDAKISSEAESAGIPKLQFNQLGQNNFQSTNGYFGMVMEMGEKKEVLPTFANPDTLEYDLTSIIYKLSKGELDKVGVMGGAGGLNPFGGVQDPYLLVRKVLEQQFALNQVPLATSSAPLRLSENKALLLLADEGTNFDENTSIQLEKYVENGGNIVVLADSISMNGQNAVKNTTGLESLLKKMGLGLSNNLVGATTAETVRFLDGEQYSYAKYPLWFRSDSFEEKSALFSGVDSLFFPWVSSIEIDASSSAKPHPLVMSPTSSWALSEPFEVAPEKQETPTEDKLKSYPLIAESSLGKGKVLLATSARLVNSEFLERAQGNFAFILNAMSNYASDGALSGIRGRSTTTTPLRPVSPEKQEVYKYLLIFSSPLLFALVGASRLARRNKSMSKN